MDTPLTIVSAYIILTVVIVLNSESTTSKAHGKHPLILNSQ